MNSKSQSITISFLKRTVLHNSLILLTLSLLCSSLVLYFWTYHFEGDPSASIFFLVLLAPPLYEIIYASIWKCTIQGENINYRSLFRRRKIHVHDIKSVSIKRIAWLSRYGTTQGGFFGINLYSESGKKLLHIGATKKGFRDFVDYLVEQKIPGAEDIPKGTR